MMRALSASALLISVFAARPVIAEPPTGDLSVRPGINDRFLDPDLDPEEWVERFEVESREAFAARRAVIDAAGVRRGHTVADVGAGTGLYAELFSEAVGGDGRVYAVDIAPKFLALIEARAKTAGRENIATVLGTASDVRLPAGSCDVAFSCDTYHHFEFPQRTLSTIFDALKPGGRWVVVDFERIEGESSDFIMGHVRAPKETVRQEIEKAGFRFVAEPDVAGLSENYLLIFERPVEAAEDRGEE